jgi:hypothetical protein
MTYENRLNEDLLGIALEGKRLLVDDAEECLGDLFVKDRSRWPELPLAEAELSVRRRGKDGGVTEYDGAKSLDVMDIRIEQRQVSQAALDTQRAVGVCGRCNDGKRRPHDVSREDLFEPWNRHRIRKHGLEDQVVGVATGIIR